MIIVKIPRSKVDEMSEYAKEMLRYGGKIMQCLEDVQNSEEMDERTRMGMRDTDYRYPMGRENMGMGYRNEDDYIMGERRSRNYRTGRYY